MILEVGLENNGYDVVIERGCLEKAGEYIDLERRVLILTDTGVPSGYAESVASQCAKPVIVTMPSGEEHKTIDTYRHILSVMLDNGFTRKDCVTAVGGGICGDVAGFAASGYMRGIDFYNIPTTVLSQVDSSVGGKTGVNLNGIKNAVGAFWQPGKVLVDADTLDTLPPRQISAGFAEALKMAVLFDGELFGVFENGSAYESTDRIIAAALALKVRVVEQDERESGLRRTLNFGHTIGHGIESLALDGKYIHGECVAMGMLPMCGPELRERLREVLLINSLPVSCGLSLDGVCRAMMHDKKTAGDTVITVRSDMPGSYYMKETGEAELKDLASMVVKG